MLASNGAEGKTPSKKGEIKGGETERERELYKKVEPAAVYSLYQRDRLLPP